MCSVKISIETGINSITVSHLLGSSLLRAPFFFVLSQVLGPLLFTLPSHHLLNGLHNIFNANKIPSAPSANAQHFSD
jgi:hypothetical protein